MRTPSLVPFPLAAALALGAAGCYYYDAQGRLVPAPVLVNSQVTVGTPGVILDHDPDEMWLIRRSGIYFVPGISADIFFFGGSWYQRDRGSWYRGSQYRGPWNRLGDDDVPRQLRRLPNDYRDAYKYKPVPYGQWKNRGYKWEDDDRDDDKGNHGRRSWQDRD